MADVSNSFLSSQKYGYDFVVSTTQASINSGLLEYVAENNQPTTHLCFLVDEHTGNPVKQICLRDLLCMTNGVNPFDIPENTPYNDPRIKALTEAKFVVGLKMRIGIPPGVLPKQLPPIVELGDSANDVTFRMFCSELTVIQNTPPNGWSGVGSWNVYEQQPGKPWYAQTQVDLVVADLEKELNTPYFNNHLKQKKAILNKLKNMSSTAFSLQQLLFDLENATLQSVPTFEGIPPNSNASNILQKSYINVFSTAAKNYGAPPVTITAVSQSQPDPSQLQMTSFEREVSQFKDNNGVVIPNPSPAQKAVATLNHLCMTNQNPLPGTSSFSWNWVDTTLASSESGVCAINRQVFGQYVLNTIMPSVIQSCITSKVIVTAKDGLGDYSQDFELMPGQKPQTSIVTDPSAGNNVVHISYTSENDPGTSSHDHQLAFFVRLDVQPKYTCNVSFIGSTIVITQRLWVYILFKWDATAVSLNGYDTTISDTYNVEVGQDGTLQITLDDSKHASVDHSQKPDRNWLVNLFTGVDTAAKKVEAKLQKLVSLDLKSIAFGEPQNFVFPAAKVFSFKSPAFSQHQDLLCDITYVNPDQPIQPPTHEGESLAHVNDQPDCHFRPSGWGSSHTAPAGEERLIAPCTRVDSPSPSASMAATSSPSLSSAPRPVTLSHSSDLIQNYVQGEIVSPTGKFEALQTDDGHALLFALNTASVLHVIKEQSGTTRTGWVPADLSSTLVKSHYAGNPQASVRTFDVGQSAVDGTIGVALVVSSGGSDELHLSLYNSSSDTSWTSNPSWTSVPFDAPYMGARPAISIVGILFAETQEKQQYIIVDIHRPTNASVKAIERYYVDPLKASGRFWSLKDFPVDIEEGGYQSCVGRSFKGYVDGVYTSGKAGGSAQLVYVPVINVFGDGPPLPSRFKLPRDFMASAIASARNTDTSSSLYGTTDLYAISGSILYRFASDTQYDGAVGKAILNNMVFQGTQQLTAMTHDGVVTIWGKNGNNQVYYISCLSSQLAVPGAWSSAVPILTGVERISPHVNRSDGGNTIFASGGGKLQRLLQATDTDAKVWRADEITLQAPSTEEPITFTSYTTSIQTLDSHNLPAGRVDLVLTAPSRTAFYINGLYYVLSQVPTSVSTDATGTLTVVEPVQDMNGTTIFVSKDGGASPITINPMDASFRKLASLNTERALRSATFPTNVVAGGVKGPAASARLIASTTHSDDVNGVVERMTRLNTVYTSVKPKAKSASSSAASTRNSSTSGPCTTRASLAGTASSALGPFPSQDTIGRPKCTRVVPHTLFHASPSLGGVADDIAVAAGDLFRWLESGIKSIVQIFEDVVSDTWHFLATIAGQVYRATLDSVDAVIGAVQWVFNTIKTDMGDLLRFLEHLFDWDDIKRTKDVLYNISNLWMRSHLDALKAAKTDFDGQVANVEKTITAWAGTTDWVTPLGQMASKPAANSASNPAAGQTSASQMLANHFKNHVADLTVVGSQPSWDIVQTAVDDLLNAIEKEGHVLSGVYAQLKDLAMKFAGMSVGQTLKALASILANGILSSVQVVADRLFEVLTDLTNAAISLLDTKIHIPVISDILNAIGITDVSFLDLFTWISAAAYTVVYRTVQSEAPFPDNADVKAIIEAPTWSALTALLQQDHHPNFATGAALAHTQAGLQDKLHHTHLAPESSHMFAVRRPHTLKSKASISSLASIATNGCTGGTTSPYSAQSTAPSTPAAIELVSASTAKAVFTAGHSVSGFSTAINVLVSALEAEGPTGDLNPYGTPAAVLGVLSAAGAGIADIALPRNPVKNDAMRMVGRITAGTTVAAKLVFSGPAQKKFKASPDSLFRGLAVNDGRATGAIVNAIMVIPAAIVTTWHFYELAGQPAGVDRSSAIVGEVSNLTNYVARVSYAVAVNDEDPESRLVPIGVMAGANVATAGLQIAQAGIH